MTNKKLRIAVIGTGWWATFAHLPTLLKHPDVAVTAICDRDLNKVQETATKHGIKDYYTDYEELFEKQELDGVVITTSNALHFGPAKCALLHGVPVLIEKPMTTIAEEARQLEELSQKTGKHVLVGYPLHFNPHVLKAKQLIAENRIGDVQFISGLFSNNCYEFYKGHPETQGLSPGDRLPDRSTYSDVSVAGGGQAVTQTTHAIALIHFISGLKITSLKANLNQLDALVDVNNALTVKFENGGVGTIGTTGLLPPGLPMNSEFRFFGEKGFIQLDTHLGTLHLWTYDPNKGKADDGALWSQNGLHEEYDIVPTEFRYPYEATINNFIEVIKGSTNIRADVSLGRHVAEVIEGIYRSKGCEENPL